MIMPQFDFFVLHKMVLLTTPLIVITGFTVTILNVLPLWISGMARLYFKGYLFSASDALKRSSFVGVNLVGALASFDLMEQFLAFSIKFSFFAAVLAFPFIAVLAAQFILTAIFSKVAIFVASVLKDIAASDSFYFSRNWVSLTTIFICVLTCNLMGMLSSSFTVTSTLAVPFLFSFSVLIVYFLTLFKKFGFKFFAGFLPAGTSVFIAPLIVLIEVVSTLAKFISLGVRLFANMFAGHLLLKVFYSLVFLIGVKINTLTFFAQIPVVLFLFFIISLEFMIAGLQAFVFLLLVSIYLKEAENFITSH